jgi:hypothetical protein
MKGKKFSNNGKTDNTRPMWMSNMPTEIQNYALRKALCRKMCFMLLCNVCMKYFSCNKYSESYAHDTCRTA